MLQRSCNWLHRGGRPQHLATHRNTQRAPRPIAPKPPPLRAYPRPRRTPRRTRDGAGRRSRRSAPVAARRRRLQHVALRRNIDALQRSATCDAYRNAMQHAGTGAQRAQRSTSALLRGGRCALRVGRVRPCLHARTTTARVPPRSGAGRACKPRHGYRACARRARLASGGPSEASSGTKTNKQKKSSRAWAAWSRASTTSWRSCGTQP